MTRCGYNNNNNKEEFNTRNSILERFTSSSGSGSVCDSISDDTSLITFLTDFGWSLVKYAGLFAIIFTVLFVRQNYLNPKSVQSIITFVVIMSAAFVSLQYLYSDMTGFLVAGIGVSVGMAVFKDQFSTVFINNSSARLN